MTDEEMQEEVEARRRHFQQSQSQNSSRGIGLHTRLLVQNVALLIAASVLILNIDDIAGVIIAFALASLWRQK